MVNLSIYSTEEVGNAGINVIIMYIPEYKESLDQSHSINLHHFALCKTIHLKSCKIFANHVEWFLQAAF